MRVIFFIRPSRLYYRIYVRTFELTGVKDIIPVVVNSLIQIIICLFDYYSLVVVVRYCGKYLLHG